MGRNLPVPPDLSPDWHHHLVPLDGVPLDGVPLDGVPLDGGTLDAWMGLALTEARRCEPAGDVPVGAIVVTSEGVVVARGHNAREAWGDPTAHAEVVALRAAAATLGQWRLSGCTLVVTLEPCVMCAGALLLARVDRLVLGAWDAKAGATGSLRDVVRDRRSNHRVEVVGGVREAECGQLLRTFFAAHRDDSEPGPGLR